RAEHGDAAAPHGLQMLAARDQVDVRAASVEGSADVRADCPGADDRDLHRSTSSARVRRCTLPVGPFGISARIVTRAGRLNAAIGAVCGEFTGSGLAAEHDNDTHLLSVLLVRHGVRRRLGDRGMGEQHVLYLVWRDLLTGPVDQLLHPAYQGEVAIRAERADV